MAAREVWEGEAGTQGWGVMERREASRRTGMDGVGGKARRGDLGGLKGKL